MSHRIRIVGGIVLRILLGVALLAPAAPLHANDKGGGDWPMWGGTPDRNMVAVAAKGLPSSWDVAKGKNVKWVVPLGSQTYGNPVVANGIVLVGTNNEGLYNKQVTGDKGILLAFRESNGEFLWQAVSDKLQAGRVNDWPYQGICSSPLVENGIVYYVTNRSEVIALDLQGFHDGENDGPFKDEKRAGKNDADILWKFDMIEELGNHPHNMSNSSPVIYQNLVFVSTSNGQDESHVNIPALKAPSIIALDKTTGKLVWEDNSVGEKILHGQWSTPTVGEIGGVVQVVSAQGDGWIRGYEALTGKKLWEFDTNPKDSVWPKTRNELISTPVIWENRVYIANGQDPEHGEGPGHLYAIDATKRGDITQSGRIWHYDKIRRSVSTPSIHNGLIYQADFSGFLHCLDARSGEVKWVHDMLAAMWGSTILADGKLYLGDEDGDVVVFEAGPAKQILSEMNMGSSVYSTPVPANGTLFVATRNQLYAIQEGAQLSPRPAAGGN